jgi:ribosome-associated protein
MSDPLTLTGGLSLPGWELSESFMTSPGPGGQNVNKVATAVELRWSLSASSLPADIKARLATRLASRLTNEGEIVLRVSETRSQARNREIARERLTEILNDALKVRRRRIATQPTYGSVRRRLEAKGRRSEIKSGRGSVTDTED